MLNESQDIASKLQCQISKEVNEVLQIENINQNEFGIFRTKKGHLIKFDEFNDYTLDQDVLVYIDKKVKSQYVMQLEYEKNYDIEQYVIEGRNYVYIRTKLVNMQNKQEIINLHLLNIYQQGSIKQLIQETLNGLQFSFKFKDQQDYFVQIIFATLFENDFKGTEPQVTNLVQQIQKNYISCKVNECKKDKELFHLLQSVQLQQIAPKFIKQCSLKTSQSIQYYKLINSIYAANIELEKNEINFNIEFTLECIKLISYSEERNHIMMEFDQYFCIDNLIYHFRFSSIQNQQRFNYYVILIQVNNDINQNQLIEELFFIIENLKCQKAISQNIHSIEKMIQINSLFIQQQQNESKEQIKIEEKTEKNRFIEEKVEIKIDEGIQQINTQSKLLYSNNNNEKYEGVQFIQINQSQGSIAQLEINKDLPLEEDQQPREVQQEIDIQHVNNDDIFDQPLQVEEQQHQQRLNQIDQYEKKTQEIQESINFNDSNNKQQQEQKIESIVFDEYNQSRRQQENLVNQNIKNNNQEEHFQNKDHNHQHQHQQQDDVQYGQKNHYDQYEPHHSHHHHHHHHSDQFRSTQYEDEQSYSEYERPIHHRHHHHHHQFHHHNHQFDDSIQENEDFNLRGQDVVPKRNNLRGRNFRNDSLYNNNDPEIIDKIIIEYNFSQQENELSQNQQSQSKKDHKKENPIPGPKKQQIQYGEDESQSQQNNQNPNNNNNKNKQSSGNQNNKQQSKSQTQSLSNDQEEGGNNEQGNDNQTQSNKQNKPNTSSTQKQNTKDKDDKQQQKAPSNKAAKTNKSGSNQEEEEASNQNNNEDDQNNKEKPSQSKSKNNRDKDKEQENQEENENQNNDESTNQQDQDQEEPAKEQDDEEPAREQEDEEPAKEQEDEEPKEEQQQDENQEEQEETAQEKQKDKQKSKTTKKQSEVNDKKKQKKNKEKAEDQEEENIENQNEEELYDFNGRYIRNDPFYEHRQSKRGRVPFNYPTRDPFYDVFEDDRFWRYDTMRRQQVRYPFNGYPYRHRKQSIDHSPFPHVNSYYKMHPYQQQTYHCSPWVGRDFYPDTGYGMSRVTAAYKGRYTDPDQVLRDLTIKQQQQKQWKKSMQQYRDQVGYKYGDYDLDFQPDYSQSYENIVQQYPDYDSTIQDPNQFQPYQEDQKKTHDYLNDPQYKFRQGRKPLVKNDRIKTFNRQQEENDCFVVYDQCNFQGNRLDLCGEYPDIPQYIDGFKIFSFIVPDNLQIRFFQSTDFENNFQNVEGTSDCLKVPYELVPNLKQ
ncbi:unnamed protein product (macronuclear) [Paramecium tetraurelia]|uniref:Uncharacterized protein n=1 Tax=Paramecium tetraurelia TaxID=5888 RepID=A0BVF2_PARTE|nr:uncharacterized protein GSPATT00005765001 [Paramecium tetraurelia]CAK62519.1 unnamed protein product [Paramecium tetraurelia]|eukprot:XP_001429917.1 hypothetical protein (macronuclear) [Paramecium tetraurelia strain d4-2]